MEGFATLLINSRLRLFLLLARLCAKKNMMVLKKSIDRFFHAEPLYDAEGPRKTHK